MSVLDFSANLETCALFVLSIIMTTFFCVLSLSQHGVECLSKRDWVRSLTMKDQKMSAIFDNEKLSGGSSVESNVKCRD